MLANERISMEKENEESRKEIEALKNTVRKKKMRSEMNGLRWNRLKLRLAPPVLN